MFNLLPLAIGRHRAAVVLEDRQANVGSDDARRDGNSTRRNQGLCSSANALSSQLSTAQYVYTGAGRVAHGATGSFKTFLLTESLKAFRLRHVSQPHRSNANGGDPHFLVALFSGKRLSLFQSRSCFAELAENNRREFPGWTFVLYFLDRRGRRALEFCIPREQGYLDMLLAKPLKRREYMLARLLPIMCVLLFIGVIASIIQWASMESRRFLIRPTHTREPQHHDRLGCSSCSDSQSAHYAFARCIYRANVGLHPFYDFNISWHVLHLQA